MFIGLNSKLQIDALNASPASVHVANQTQQQIAPIVSDNLLSTDHVVVVVVVLASNGNNSSVVAVACIDPLS